MISGERDILLLSATEGEAMRLIESLDDLEAISRAGKTTLRGRIGKAQCRISITGIGVVNTAHALTCQLESRLPGLVLQLGIAGAYVPSGLTVGSLACASEEIYGDLGVLTAEGWQPVDLIGIPVVPGDPPRFNRFPLDPDLTSWAASVTGAQVGSFVTVSQCSGVQSVGDALACRFGALCESMEGAAAAHVCALYGVPFLEIRGVSNLVEDRDRSRWNIPAAVNVVQDAVLKLLAAKWVH